MGSPSYGSNNRRFVVELFENNVYCAKCNNFLTALSAADRLPASGSFIDMLGIDHGVFLIGMGTFTTSATWQVYQDTAATETAAKVVTGASQAVVNSTDNNKWLTIEFDANQLDRGGGFRYVTLVPSAGTGGDDYAVVYFLGFRKSKRPVTQPANYAYHVAVM